MRFQPANLVVECSVTFYLVLCELLFSVVLFAEKGVHFLCTYIYISLCNINKADGYWQNFSSFKFIQLLDLTEISIFKNLYKAPLELLKVRVLTFFIKSNSMT